MAYNYRPIFTNYAVISGSRFVSSSFTSFDLSTANATANPTTSPFSSGSAANNIYQVYKSNATEGDYISKIRFKPLGTNVASVARIFVSDGTGATGAGTGDNSILIDELSLPATTANAAAALPTYELPLNFALPSGYVLYVTMGTAVAAGYDISVFGGTYTAAP